MSKLYEHTAEILRAYDDYVLTLPTERRVIDGQEMSPVKYPTLVGFMEYLRGKAMH